jgi:hypothetical protein
VPELEVHGRAFYTDTNKNSAGYSNGRKIIMIQNIGITVKGDTQDLQYRVFTQMKNIFQNYTCYTCKSTYLNIK